MPVPMKRRRDRGVLRRLGGQRGGKKVPGVKKAERVAVCGGRKKRI